MPAKINLLKQTFGKLQVIEETSKRKNKSVVWKCQCECGNIEEFSTKELRNDGIIQCSNCGTNREPKSDLIKKDIIGQQFNNLLVLEKTEKRQCGKILYKCQCNCEKQTIIYVNCTDLQSGHTKSCGCMKRKYNIGDIINNRQIIGIEESKNNRLYYKCKCLLCDREYLSLSYNLQKTISCGCQKSLGEYNIITILEQNNIKYIKEYSFQNSYYRYDFALLDNNNKIIRLIEFDGEQHYEKNIKNTGWNTYEKYQYTLKNDIEKNILAHNNNIPLVRIPYWERDNITLELLLSDKYLIS